MWHVFEAFRKQRIAKVEPDRIESGPIIEINPRELILLLTHVPDRLMIFDLRHSSEVERHPSIIPDALLTTNIDLFELMPWIPPETIVVFYAAEHIPRDFVVPVPQSSESTTYVLKGGLRSWWEAGLPVERVSPRHEEAHSSS